MTIKINMKNRNHVRGSIILTQIIKFGVVGIVGFITNAGIVVYFSSNIGPIYSQMIAFPVAVFITWLLNRNYTFGISRYSWRQEFYRYLLGNLLGWAINNGTYFFLILNVSFVYQNPLIAVAAGSLSGMILNFIFSRRVFTNETY